MAVSCLDGAGVDKSTATFEFELDISGAPPSGWDDPEASVGGISMCLAMEVALMLAARPRHLGDQIEWPGSPRAPTCRAPPDGPTDVRVSSHDGAAR